MNQNKLIIIGAGGHGRVAFDIAKLCGYDTVAFLDDNAKDNPLVLGTLKDVEKYKDDYVFFVGIGHNQTRKLITEQLISVGAKIVSLIHPSAIIGGNVTIDNGVIIMAGVVINTGATLSSGVIVNTCASVDHDSFVGKFSHVAVGAHLCGGIKVGENCLLGAGSIVINGVSVEDNVTIGAGGVVTKNIEQSGVYVGVPAKRVD